MNLDGIPEPQECTHQGHQDTGNDPDPRGIGVERLGWLTANHRKGAGLDVIVAGMHLHLGLRWDAHGHIARTVFSVVPHIAVIP